MRALVSFFLKSIKTQFSQRFNCYLDYQSYNYFLF